MSRYKRRFKKELKRVKLEKQRLEKKLDVQNSEKQELQKQFEILQDRLADDGMKSCRICNEPYNDTERETVKLECPHIFCKMCTIQVQRIGNSLCPYCRKPFGQFYPVKF